MMRLAARRNGFTLVEVMIALALLGLSLIVTMKSSSSSIYYSLEAEMMGITTDLARMKMYETEEFLTKEGFADSDQSKTGDFAEQGYPNVAWEAKVDQVELPPFAQLQELARGAAVSAAQDRAKALGSAAPPGLAPPTVADSDDKCSQAAGGATNFSDSALGGMLGLMGAGPDGGVDGAAAGGGAFIQSQFQLFQQLLKASIRKVTLTLKWQVLGRDRDMKVVAYFTDPAGLTKVMGLLGAGGGTPTPNNPSPNGGNPTPNPGPQR